MWECTECEVENDFDPDAEEGQILTCVECGAEYGIVSLEPLELSLMDTSVAVDVDVESDDDDDWDDG